MNIEELEFIRDFSDDLDYLNQSIQCVFLAVNDDCFEEDTEKALMKAALKSLHHHSELVMRELHRFKEKIDLENCHVWKNKYPEME